MEREYAIVLEQVSYLLYFQMMMGIVQTADDHGIGRAGVMISVPCYSMYQARLLQYNSHQVPE